MKKIKFLSFNGEIYNYLELKELESLGYNFKTNGDTEVLLKLHYWKKIVLRKLKECLHFVFVMKKTKKFI